MKSISRPADTRIVSSRTVSYRAVVGDLVELIESSRRAAARRVNALMTATYFLVGKGIVEHEQHGRARAGYGDQLLDRLSRDLTARLGRGFSADNLATMRLFYLAYRGEAARSKKTETPSRESRHPLSALAERFPLPWSHYVKLVRQAPSVEARRFYEAESLRGGWTVRQLARQMGTQFYQRTLLSRDKAAVLARGSAASAADSLTAESELKDPMVLEFLGLKDEYSESDLEEALISKLEGFLLELGIDFAFVGRQKRLRVGDAWYRVDLIFFHRSLRSLVIVDLKLGELTHADAGQMHLYLNYAKEHWTRAGENPPVGLILCAKKDAAVARYALDGLANKILAAEYKMVLPHERVLERELERTQRLLGHRPALRSARVPAPPRSRPVARAASTR